MLNAGKVFAFTGRDENLVSEFIFPGDCMPEKMKSSTVTIDGSLQGKGMDEFEMTVGIQKSWTGSGSEPKMGRELKQQKKTVTKRTVILKDIVSDL